MHAHVTYDTLHAAMQTIDDEIMDLICSDETNESNARLEALNSRRSTVCADMQRIRLNRNAVLVGRY